MLSQEGTTQGDPLAMAMYALGIIPLIYRLRDESAKQTWYADDATSGSSLTSLKAWCDNLVKLGPDFVYYLNASKTWVIAKENKHEAAVAAFQGADHYWRQEAT